MRPSGIYYDECPYCGQFNHERDSRGGCPACGGRYPEAEQEIEELEPDYDTPYYSSGGVSLMDGHPYYVWGGVPGRPRENERIDEDIFEERMRRWLGG